MGGEEPEFSEDGEVCCAIKDLPEPDVDDSETDTTVDKFSDEEAYGVDEDGTLLIYEAEKRRMASKFDGQQFGNVKKYPELEKYWTQRYRFWSRFDEGIYMDVESWYSVTPELIAKHIAERLRIGPHDVVIDAFSGAGGNTIQFALVAKRVIAIDIDPNKLQIARHNARVYGVEDKVDYVLGDFTRLLPTLEADVVFLSPPWGGPRYNSAAYFDLRDIQLDGKGEVNGISLFHDVREYITRNVIYYLPKNTLADQIVRLMDKDELVEIEQNILNEKVKSITVYTGQLAATPATSTNGKPPLAQVEHVPQALIDQVTKSELWAM